MATNMCSKCSGATSDPISNILSSAVPLVSSLLADPKVEEMESNADRISASTSVNAASIVQAAVKPSKPLNPDFDVQDDFLSMSYSFKTAEKNPTKMIRLDGQDWTTTRNWGDLIYTAPLPQLFWQTPQRPAYGQSRYFKYVRMGFHFQCQINAPQGAAGCLIMYYIPKAIQEAGDDTEVFAFSSFTNLPHVLLNASTTTAGDLFIPYVNHQNFSETDSTQLGAIEVRVWAPLVVAQGTSTTVDIVLYGSVIEMDFQCPRPIPTTEEMPQVRKKTTKVSRHKWVRQNIDISEGPGSMNVANKLHTAGGQTIALVGERAYYDPRTAGATARYNDMMQVAQNPVLFDIGNHEGIFLWNGTQVPSGVVFQANISLGATKVLQVFQQAYQFWRGSIEIQLTVFHSVFNKGRLRMCWFPLQTTAYSYEASNNSQYLLCDIGLQSSFKMTIPYAYPMWQRETGNVGDLTTGVLGRLQIHVSNRLTYNTAAPTSVWCTLMISCGKDAIYNCPAGDGTTWQLGSWGSLMDLEDPEANGLSFSAVEEPDNIKDQPGLACDGEGTFESDNVIFSQSNKAAVEVGASSVENAGSQEDQLKSAQPKFLNFKVLKRNIYTVSHTDVDNLFGRAWNAGLHSWTTEGAINIPIYFPTAGHGALARFFTYWVGELNLHIINQSEGFLRLTHAYDGFHANPDRASYGIMIIPPKENMTVCVPYYSKFPLRIVRPYATNTPMIPLGTLNVYPTEATGSFALLISLRQPNFFFRTPAPNKATVSLIESDHAVQYFPNLETIKRAMALLECGEQYVHRISANTETIVQSSLKRAKEWHQQRRQKKRDLSICGDVEKNPGPFDLVYKNRGLYKHYGVRTSDGVWNLNSQDIIRSCVNGMTEFILSPDDDEWKKEYSFTDDYFTKQYLRSLQNTRHVFSCNLNCETLARAIAGDNKITQSTALGIAGLIILTATLSTMLTTGDYDTITHKYVFEQGVEDASGLSSLVQRAMTFVTSCYTEQLNHELVRTILMTIMRILCYLIMFCHCPNVLTSLSLGCLLYMDFTTMTAVSPATLGLFRALVDGDVCKLATVVAESMETSSDEEMQQMVQSSVRETTKLMKVSNENSSNTSDESFNFTDFNRVSMSAKHFDWWLGKIHLFYQWLKTVFCPSEEEKVFKWIQQNTALINSMITTADNHLANMKDPVYYRQRENQDKHRYLLTRVSMICRIMAQCAGTCPLTQLLFRLHSSLLRHTFAQPVISTMYRQEPIGIWISGPPGQGKSFFVQSLVKKLLKACNLYSTFTQPTGSEFMDGYAQQDIHIIDDLGQNREEKDVALLCQCISSVPFCVPMADTTEKGMQYESKFVIATTNKGDFVTTKLTDPDALKRRFPYRFEICAKRQFLRHNYLDVAHAMPHMIDGSCWEYSTDGNKWETVDLAHIVSNLKCEFILREHALSQWTSKVNNQGAAPEEIPLEEINGLSLFQNQFPESVAQIQTETTDSLSSIVDSFEQEKVKDTAPFHCADSSKKVNYENPTEQQASWFKTKWDKFLGFFERNAIWIRIIGILGSLIGLGAMIWRMIRKEEKDERPYNPQTTFLKGGNLAISKQPRHNIVVSNEGPYQSEIAHLQQFLCYFSSDNHTTSIHGIVMGSNRVLIYGHSMEWFKNSYGTKLHYKSAIFPIDHVKSTNIEYRGQPLDMMILEVSPMPILFKDASRYFSPEIGVRPMLLWFSPDGNIILHVNNVKRRGLNITTEGSVCASTLEYSAPTKKGMCGGVLVSNVKGSYKINSMHVAGNGVIGVGAEIHLLTNLPSQIAVQNEGIIRLREPAERPLFVNARTVIKPSPLHGIFPITMGPAVLTPKDPRLEEKTESIVEKCLSKYTVSQYDPCDLIFEPIQVQVTTVMLNAIGRHGCLSMEEACRGKDGLNPIEMSTSAGVKYSQQNLTKRDLMCLDPFWMHPKLLSDVQSMYADLAVGVPPRTVFGTYLKDELRSISKIKQGKTRCIEACSLDYTICHRMVMGNIYAKIYSTPATQTGLAVGINPWQDFDPLYYSLNSCNYCLDFTAFDGSLSYPIMAAAVEVLAELHDDPDMVRALFITVLDSKHLVMRDNVYVFGGMPSGAPCTTILNSICNILMCRYATHIAAPIYDTGDIQVIAYGDDVIISTDTDVDTAEFRDVMMEAFGMVVTGTDKSPLIMGTQRGGVSFLKRTFAYFPKTQYVVGKLDLDSMLQHIMWMKSTDFFSDQLLSFENELVLHGKQVYEEIFDIFEPRLAERGFSMSRFNLAYRRMVHFVFE